MLLRPCANSTYQVVGNCWIYGIMDGESLLGPLPPSWEINIDMYSQSNSGECNDIVRSPTYHNISTNTKTSEDPRLGQLPDHWEAVAQLRTPNDPMLFAPHRNKLTGNIMNSDPRLLPELLRERGVNLQTFMLV